ncbi:MAG TPA: hypothetical protein VH164_09545 [Ktedonobacteraceae bacterium]|nr:hypothetical protein [Ktedonobacteraceae bacterium]
MTTTTVAVATAATAISGRVEIVITTHLAALASKSKSREQTAHFLAVTFHTDHIIGVLVVDQQFKFSFTV